MKNLKETFKIDNYLSKSNWDFCGNFWFWPLLFWFFIYLSNYKVYHYFLLLNLKHCWDQYRNVSLPNISNIIKRRQVPPTLHMKERFMLIVIIALSVSCWWFLCKAHIHPWESHSLPQSGMEQRQLYTNNISLITKILRG